jgi:hypothetical protein
MGTFLLVLAGGLFATAVGDLVIKAIVILIIACILFACILIVNQPQLKIPPPVALVLTWIFAIILIGFLLLSALSLAGFT